ncbi:MAG: hypothetical protein OXF05_03515 [Hyphomicrobiales bacterium]|nr:hypothetical protein [Hyphomicrobiales bacterium]
MSSHPNFVYPSPLINSYTRTAITTNFPAPTFSSFAETLVFSEDSDIQEFEQKIASVYAELAKKQKPLGREFEAILNANIERLYKS